MSSAGRDDLAAILRRHSRPKAVAALAHELAGLIGPLHGSSPVSITGASRRACIGRGTPHEHCHEKTISARGRSAVSRGAYDGREPRSQRCSPARGPLGRASGGHGAAVTRRRRAVGNAPTRGYSAVVARRRSSRSGSDCLVCQGVMGIWRRASRAIALRRTMSFRARAMRTHSSTCLRRDVMLPQR